MPVTRLTTTPAARNTNACHTLDDYTCTRHLQHATPTRTSDQLNVHKHQIFAQAFGLCYAHATLDAVWACSIVDSNEAVPLLDSKRRTGCNAQTTLLDLSVEAVQILCVCVKDVRHWQCCIQILSVWSLFVCVGACACAYGCESMSVCNV